MPKQYYLAKTDPETYPVEKFRAEGRTVWDGVKNAQALQAIRSMRKNDRVLIYHSMGHAAVVGLATVVEDARPDPNDTKLVVVDLEFLSLLDPPVTLKEIKESKLFDDWALVRQSRLSTMTAPSAFIEWIRPRFPKIKI